MNFGSPLKSKKITRELILEVSAIAPRRICFSSCHKDALKLETGNYLGKFSVPFKETIKQLFEYETDITLFLNLDRYWYSIKKGHEIDLEKILSFIEKYNNIVFLRDTLDLSIALSENISERNELTLIGKLEDDAKYKQDSDAIKELSKLCDAFIVRTPFYKTADFVCAIPSSDPTKDNLPREVIKLLVNTKATDISRFVNWKQKKPPLKELGLDKKMTTLDSIELLIETDIKNKNIILIDDLYQSGTTIQYIAMKLKDAGASFVYGLSFVKARNDKDYV